MRTFIDTLNGIKDSTVIEILAGEPMGSIVNLIFNKENSSTSLVVYCSWRLEKNDSIVTGWNEGNDVPNGFLTSGIKQLTLKKVKEVSCSKFYDLQIIMEDDIVLNIFCDRTPNEDILGEIDNIVLSDEEANVTYRVTNSFEIKTESYN